MDKSNTKIDVPLGEILNASLLGAWDYICNKYGLHPYAINEGRAGKKDTIKISIKDAEYIGVLKD